jgi:hypothetical protein
MGDSEYIFYVEKCSKWKHFILQRKD